MPFRSFFCLLLLLVGASALTSYFVSHSIRSVVVTTMGAWLLLQVAYFASMLFLIWRSSRAQSGRQKGKRFDHCQEARYQSQAYHEGNK
ncbi:conserved exported hypothetical protein [Rhizobium mesoamericanum STM3625]|uniref:LPS synthesis regulator SyrA n=1 Tax=Rhizobium mesoamericanum STM3625 TaxID=1211777 RepID=K0Q4X1_9HYPH|nr:conserved exported hypothetical protein [Rhizobium mesoamericanum STM3625]